MNFVYDTNRHNIDAYPKQNEYENDKHPEEARLCHF